MPGIEITKDDIAEAKATELTDKSQLYGLWKIAKIEDVYIEGIDPSTIESREAKNKIKKELKSKGTYFGFFPDGKASYVKAKKYRGATWSIQGNKVNFTLLKEGMNREANSHEISEIKFYSKKDRKIMKLKIEKMGQFELVQEEAPLTNFEEDPYHPKNNQWRVTARKSETYKQMRQRLYNYTQHCHLLFKSALDREETRINASNTSSIYKYYDSAIALVDGGKVPDAWMSNYYSPDEAMDAYAMAKKYFDGKILRGKSEPGKNGFIVANEAVFRTLLEKMEKDL